MLKSISLSVSSALESARKQIPYLDALLLMEHSLNIDRAHLMAHLDKALSAAQAAKFKRLVVRRFKGEPVAYILGKKEFYGLELRVTPDVLIPRPETEDLVEFAIKDAQEAEKLLDVGTGSGAIAIAVAKTRPDLEITASDISAAALKVAKYNATRHSVNIKFIRSNLFLAIKKMGFDLVVANLPYVRDKAALSPEGMQEPAQALRGGNDGLGIYRRFFAEVCDYLSPNGYVIIEAEPAQHNELIKIAKTAHLKHHDTRNFAIAFRF